ncbi:VOC family protein [Candidatus Woesearchaeota archaeon]|nr:VOC family protein [Candidatus Woesearchaeota archaeon]
MKNYIHHITLTVRDIDKSSAFYKNILDWKIFDKDKEYASFGPKNKRPFLWVSLPRDQNRYKNEFDRNNIGLDHFAFEVESMDELKKIENRLKKLKIKMDDGGITDDGFGGTGIFCYDPDGMKVEFHLK